MGLLDNINLPPPAERPVSPSSGSKPAATPDDPASLGTMVIVSAVLVACVILGNYILERQSASTAARAIALVRETQCPMPGFARVIGTLTGLSGDGTCGSLAELRATMNAGSSEGFRWVAAQDFQGLTADEWMVRYVNGVGSGYFFVADLASGRVVDPAQDEFLGARVGFIVESSSVLRFEVESAGIVRCSDWSHRGWCFDASGTATNTGEEALTGIEVDMKVSLRLGSRTHEGEGRPRPPDPFRATSTSHPWPSRETRSFHYRSKILPDVLGTERGDLLGIMKIATETVTHGMTSEHAVVRFLPWEPDNLPR